MVAHVLQFILTNSGVSVMRLGVHFCQEIKARYVFQDVENRGCNELLVVLLLERNGEAQACFLGV